MTTDWMTRKEVAAYLRISTRTVDRWREAGFLKAYPRGGRILYRRSEVDAALRSAHGEA